MNIILMQKTYAILVKDYSITFDSQESALHNLYKNVTQEYRNMFSDLVVGRYFSTRKYPKLQIVDVSFYFNGHITIHSLDQDSTTYLNFSFDEVTFLWEQYFLSGVFFHWQYWQYVGFVYFRQWMSGTLIYYSHS